MKKFLLPLALAMLATVNTESCDPETKALAEEGLDKMNEIMTNGTSYEYGDCTLVIRDNADLISDAEEQKIVNNLAGYCADSPCDILLMTTKEIGLSSLSPGVTYAQMYLPENSENWICLTYDVKREQYSVYYDGSIAKSACGGTQTDTILNAGAHHFKHEEYAKGLEAMAEQCLKNITNQARSSKTRP